MLSYAHEHFSERAETLALSEFRGACSICRAPLRQATRCRGEGQITSCNVDCELFVCDECGLMQSNPGFTCLQAGLPR